MISNQNSNRKIINTLFDFDFARLGKALETLFLSNSNKHGNDALEISMLACEYLNKNHICKAKVIIGDVAWRVNGTLGAGVIAHHHSQLQGMTNAMKLTGLKSIPFHAWVSLNDVWYIDFTTYQFKVKMAQLDDIDGLTTPVRWQTDFLVFRQSQLCTYDKVMNGYKTGLAFYAQNPKTEQLINSLANNENLDSDLHALSIMFEANDKGIKVIGPCSSINHR